VFAECIKKTIHPATWAVIGMKKTAKGPETGHRGTAFAVDSKGHLITCAHVTYYDEACTVELDEFAVFQPELGPTMHKAKLIARDGNRDVALLKIDADVKTPAVPLLRDRVPWGKTCCAFGHPLSVLDQASQTMRVFTRAAGGVVSMPYNGAIDANGTPISLYELDFFTHGGASGGPVFLRTGEVFAYVRASLMLPDATGKHTRSNLSMAVDIHEAVEFLKANNVNPQVRGRTRG
jgi:S1-C subfamily serine protease